MPLQENHHLTHNLWLEKGIDYELLHDSVASPLDVAMAVRRDGISGSKTPDGILTRMEGTHFARIIKEIENETNLAAIDLGLMPLDLSEDTVRTINEGISCGSWMPQQQMAVCIT